MSAWKFSKKAMFCFVLWLCFGDSFSRRLSFSFSFCFCDHIAVSITYCRVFLAGI